MAGRITQRTIDALKPGEIAWDGELKGFGARCTASGVSYVAKYRAGHGRGARQRWVTIGRHSEAVGPLEARKKATRVLRQAGDGVDPAANRDSEKAALTLRDLAHKFLGAHVEAKRKGSTASDYRRLLEHFALPAFGSMPVDAVTRADVARLHQGMSDTPRQANYLLSVLSKMFSWAEARGFRREHANPCRMIERYSENKRERFLSEAELSALGAVLTTVESEGSESLYAVAAVRLLLFTGARLNEILTARWDYFDGDRGWLRLPTSKTGAKTVHLNAPALEILSSLPRFQGNPYIIVGREPGGHLVNLQKPWRRIRKLAALDDVRLHDLRHSFASVAASGGHSLPIIGRLLGHTQAQTTARYAHLANDPVKAAGEAVAKRIAASLAGKSGDVVQLAARKRAGTV